ncbi:WxcM-like domain-containing protein [Dyella flava]|uniref:WxcM-like domain-containing protein n=1 Tax=Dyella flava TaxID=1920170 RepID=A0ABS2JYC7_9GAMM|nr:WxcM-like domain-containing protein [Dyella flava]MBM7123992.1 WxcM-like domain-containing protein [Dyella flava]GLQ50562.1 isomerase [Dyella flava]
MKQPEDAFIHPLADVSSTSIGARTRLWQFVVVLPGAVIGEDCNICAHCFVENDVVIGSRVTIKNGVQLWDGLRVGDDVFIGPNVTFTNDKFPRSRQHPEEFLTTRIDSGVSIGGGATILPGLKIGRNAMVGAGAVVTRSIPPNAIVVGNPARIVGYVDTYNKNQARTQTTEVKSVTGEIAQLYRLPRITDIRGSLSVGEFERSVPFAVKRYFMVFDVPSVETRGEHAHRECHQFLVCVRGSVTVLADDGQRREEFVLDRPELGLHLRPMVWGVQYKYSSDAMLLVFASHHYDADDYIRDYEAFLALTGESK